jgi:hypothetical protein
MHFLPVAHSRSLEGGHRSAMSAPTANPAAASHNSVGKTRHHIAPPQDV